MDKDEGSDEYEYYIVHYGFRISHAMRHEKRVYSTFQDFALTLC